MEQEQDIHTRLNYMEEKFESKLGIMADAISDMANSIKVISERQADITLLMERSNQHTSRMDNQDHRLDKHDERIDKIEVVMPLIDRFMGRADKISLAVIILLITGMIGSIIHFS